jgi:hypothetical protein
MVKTSVFQTEDEGSIPSARSRNYLKRLIVSDLYLIPDIILPLNPPLNYILRVIKVGLELRLNPVLACHTTVVGCQNTG